MRKDDREVESDYPRDVPQHGNGAYSGKPLPALQTSQLAALFPGLVHHERVFVTSPDEACLQARAPMMSTEALFVPVATRDDCACRNGHADLDV